MFSELLVVEDTVHFIILLKSFLWTLSAQNKNEKGDSTLKN